MAAEQVPKSDGAGTDWIPRPDPTKLTTDQLYREIGALEKFMDSRLNCAEELVEDVKLATESRISALEKFHDAEIRALKELHNAAIHDTQENVKLLTTVLQAAITKSEITYTKQFDAVNLNIQTQNQANTDRINDIKERLDRNEGAQSGKIDTEKEHRDNTGLWIGLASALIAFMALAIGAVGLFIANYHKA
jgi:Fe-S-cluster formation regulator IscX/YfhJ